MRGCDLGAGVVFVVWLTDAVEALRFVLARLFEDAAVGCAYGACARASRSCALTGKRSPA